jgi:hypothetical protein
LAYFYLFQFDILPTISEVRKEGKTILKAKVADDGVAEGG